MFQKLAKPKKPAAVFYCRTLLSLAILLTSISSAFAQSATRLNPTQSNVVRDSAQTEPDSRPLEPGKNIERNLSGGQVHTYRVKLAANDYLHLVVEQKSVDVTLRLVAPDGRQLAEVNRTQPPGFEPIKFIAPQSGEYVLEVRPVNANEGAGSYDVKIKDLRPAVELDQERLAADRIFLEAELLRAQKTTEAQRGAAQKYQSLLPLLKATGDRGEEADALGVLGTIHRDLGESQQALDYFERRRILFREMGDHAKEAATLGGICYYYKELDEHQKALDCLNDRLLPLNRSLADREGEADTLATIGLIYSDLSEYQKALDFNNQALLLSRANGYRGEEALALANLGLTYNRLGESQKALDHYSQALPVFQQVGHRGNVAMSLHNMGVAYKDLGEYQKALDHFKQVLMLFQEMGYRLGEAHALYNAGIVYQKLGDAQKALEYLQKALQIFKDLHSPRGEGRTLIYIGATNQALGEPSRALENFEQALSLFRTVEDKGGEAFALYNLARNDGAAGRLDSARARIEQALKIVESLRAGIVSQELRASYLASVRSYYEFYVDLLMRMHQEHPAAGHDADALQASERARARSLLELLNESGVDIRQGVEPALLERERDLQQLLNNKAERQTRLLSSFHPAAQTAELVREIASLTIEYEQVRAEIRIHSRGYAALTQPQPLSLKEIQTRVLDSDTVLLEFALGEERSYLWAATPTSLSSFILPGRLEIETTARRVYEMLTARSKHVEAETPEQRKLRIAQADAEYPATAAALSQMLLGPAASQLEKKRLLIIADGALAYVPFAALPIPLRISASASPSNQPPLIVEHEVVSLPSASTLAVLRRQVEGRKPAGKSVAVLADPVFDKEDARVQTSIATNRSRHPATLGAQTDFSREVVRAMEDVGEAQSLQRLPRLYNTRAEADVIRSLVPARDTLQALDFAASLKTAIDPELGQYRIVHFATHAFANNVHPELSGIVLSLVDRNGQPQDGFLRTNEIFNLKLPAELVVLSACRTGLGKEVKGEGLIGLTRGFMYAGTPRVIVSLWSMSDKPTAELMARLYKKLLGPVPERPAAALRSAQLEMLKDKRWEQPYFWAGFVLQGEWR